ncbi:hypothetical protein yinte0001_14600 [Yersinia intermedia ATCC 29909]|nr:hypothetical protein yinte0001_14600 [Yersinia intermedia ATCC 29909]
MVTLLSFLCFIKQYVLKKIEQWFYYKGKLRDCAINQCE